MSKKIFDKVIDRSTTNERKWDLEFIKDNYNIKGNNFINASIADMDFLSPKPIRKAIVKRAKMGTYSYTFVNQNSLSAIVNWYKLNHKITLDKSYIKIVHGTVNAMYQIVQALTKSKDNILLQTPIYKPFANSILSNNRQIIENKLVFDSNIKDYVIDFEDFETKIKENNIKLFMLCHPHNPSNRAWTENEIIKMLDICQKYNVIVFSDEVHSDLYFSNKFYSTLNVKSFNNLVVANSPNKCFNLGGLKTSYLIIPNKELREVIEKQYDSNSITSPNIFGITALTAAYSDKKCLAWLNDVKEFWEENYNLLCNELSSIDNLIITKYNSSFLVWINHESIMTSNRFKELSLNNNLVVSFANDFFGQTEGWFRISIGCSKNQLNKIISLILKILNS